MWPMASAGFCGGLLGGGVLPPADHAVVAVYRNGVPVERNRGAHDLAGLVGRDLGPAIVVGRRRDSLVGPVLRPEDERRVALPVDVVKPGARGDRSGGRVDAAEVNVVVLTLPAHEDLVGRV